MSRGLTALVIGNAAYEGGSKLQNPGHDMQIDGENCLAAVDTDTEGELEAKHSSLPLNRVIEVMEKAETTTNIVILDACRDNPFERAWTRSLTSPPAGSGPTARGNNAGTN